MKTTDEKYHLTVPRQEFIGWLLSVAAYAEAGLSDVHFIFNEEELRLLSYWGETKIGYEGRFQGKVTIKPQRLLTLARKGERIGMQPIPIKLTVDVTKRVMAVDLIEVSAAIEVLPLAPKPAKTRKRAPTCVGITISAGQLVNLIKQALPGKVGKKEMIQITAAGAELIIQSNRALARKEAIIIGRGEWAMPADLFRNVIGTFKASEMLTLEVDSKGLRLNSFSMPILNWRSVSA